jgi:hypothetical protein
MGLIPFQGIITWSAYLLNSILWFSLGIASVKGRSYLYHYYPEVAMEAMAPPSRTWRQNQAFHDREQAKWKREGPYGEYHKGDHKGFWRKEPGKPKYRVHRKNYGDSKGPWRKEPGKPTYHVLHNHRRPSQYYTPPTKRYDYPRNHFNRKAFYHTHELRLRHPRSEERRSFRMIQNPAGNGKAKQTAQQRKQGCKSWTAKGRYKAYLLNSILWFGLGVASVKGRPYLYHYYPEVAMEAMSPPSRTWRQNQAFHDRKETKWKREGPYDKYHKGDSKGFWRKEPGKPIYQVLCNQCRQSQNYTLPEDVELVLCCSVFEPIESHVNGFAAFLFDGSIDDAICCAIISSDWGWWL